jgi:uncharacterized membrane protein YkoI
MSIALITGGFMAGAVLAGAQIAGAQDGASSSAAVSTDDSTDPMTVRHGPGETLLTGNTAERVEAAALEEVPNGTVIRVETDAGGAAYEAHVATADGDLITVTFDEDFDVIDTESGFAGGAPLERTWDGSGN